MSKTQVFRCPTYCGKLSLYKEKPMATAPKLTPKTTVVHITQKGKNALKKAQQKAGKKPG